MKDDQFKIAITEILYLLSLANTDAQQVQVWADISTIALSCAIKLKKENKMRNKTKYDELEEKWTKQRALRYFGM